MSRRTWETVGRLGVGCCGSCERAGPYLNMAKKVHVKFCWQNTSNAPDRIKVKNCSFNATRTPSFFRPLIQVPQPDSFGIPGLSSQKKTAGLTGWDLVEKLHAIGVIDPGELARILEEEDPFKVKNCFPKLSHYMSVTAIHATIAEKANNGGVKSSSITPRIVCHFIRVYMQAWCV